MGISCKQILFHSMPWENLSTTGISANWVTKLDTLQAKMDWTLLFVSVRCRTTTHKQCYITVLCFSLPWERKWSWVTLYCLYCLFFGIWLHIKTDTVSNYVRKGCFGKKQREVTFLFDIGMFRVVLMKHWLFSKIRVHLVWKWKLMILESPSRKHTGIKSIKFIYEGMVQM